MSSGIAQLTSTASTLESRKAALSKLLESDEAAAFATLEGLNLTHVDENQAQLCILASNAHWLAARLWNRQRFRVKERTVQVRPFEDLPGRIDAAFDFYLSNGNKLDVEPEVAAQLFGGLQMLCDAGDIRAQFALGLAHAFGIGVARDNARAVEWLTKAAERGMVSAQLLLVLVLRRSSAATVTATATAASDSKSGDEANAAAAAKWLDAATAQLPAAPTHLLFDAAGLDEPGLMNWLLSVRNVSPNVLSEVRPSLPLRSGI